MKEMNTRVINKHDYEVNWVKATNFVPKRGELIIYDAEFDDLGNTVALPAGRTASIFYARYKIGDGVTNVNSLPFANAEDVDLSNYIQYKDIIQSHNYFGGKKLYISRLDDVLYAADKRFNVSAANYSNAGDLNRNYSAAEIGYLFDGKCEDPNFTVAAGTYSVINITIPDGNYRELGQLPYGNILLSFYADNMPENVSMRVYCDYANHGIGWHDLVVNNYVNNGVDQLIKIARNDYYNISQIEITVAAKDTIAATLSSVEMILDRPGSINPIVSKYKPETLYYDLTAPNFIGTASKARADANGNDIASTYMRYGEILQTTNPFGGKSLYISKIDDALYAADKRFDVKFDHYDSSGSLFWEADAGTVAKLFNGNYEDFGSVNAECSGKITITLPDYRALADYPYGNILLSFYYDMIPESVSARVYCNYEPQGVGWKDLPVSIHNLSNGQTNAVYSIRNDFYQISQIEITVTAPAAHAAYITTIEMKMDRPAFDKTPFLSKYGPETLYYDLTAPNFIGNASSATCDDKGNIISETYATKEEIGSYVEDVILNGEW